MNLRFLSALCIALSLLGASIIGCGDAEDEGGYSDNNASNNASNNAGVNNSSVNNSSANNSTANNSTGNNSAGNNSAANNSAANNSTANNNPANNSTGNNNPAACGEHALGERWTADDGCNTCTCTEAGPACTEIACANACEDIEASYQGAVASAKGCAANDECIILYGQCGVGLGGCYESVNASVTQEELNALGAQFTGAGCTAGVCDCAPPPPPACVEGVCGFLEATPCGEHALGESWSDDDGCNTCTCTEGGPICTERACVDACEEIVDAYAAAVAGAKACDSHDACQLLYGQCGVGLGGCYEAVNTSITQEELGALGNDFQGAGCIAGVCSCAPPPPVGCMDGACTFLPYCEGHDLGEVWLDGCSSCECTFDGVVCTDNECTTCETLEGDYQRRIESNQGCQADDECQALNTSCSIYGTCWAAANQGVTQDELNDLLASFNQEGCDGPVCRCPAPPAGAFCDAGTCALR